MTSSDAVTRTSVPPSGVGARLVAAATALVLALTVLVAPGARAADAAPPVTIEVVQDEVWWEGGGERSLAATAFGTDGEPVTGGEYAVQVAPAVRYDLPWSDGRLTFDVGRLAVGPVAVTVAWRPADGQPWTTAKATFEVSRGTIPSTVRVTAPSFVEFDEDVYADVKVDVAGDGSRSGEIYLERAGYAVGFTGRTNPETGAGRLRIPSGDPGTTRVYEVVFRGESGVASSRTVLTVTTGKAREQIRVTPSLTVDGGWPMSLGPWDVTVDVGRSGLADGTITLHDETGRVLARQAASKLDHGWARFTLRPDQLAAGRRTIEARLTGSSAVVDARASFTVTVRKERAAINTVDSRRAQRWGRPHVLDVGVHDTGYWVSDWGGPRPTGKITVYRGKARLWTGSLDRAALALPSLGGKSLPVGRSTVRIEYSGDRYYTPATIYRKVTVRKAETKIKADLVDKTVVGNQRVKVRLRISSPSNIPDVGTVRIKLDGKVVKTVRITKKHDGRRTVTLPRHHGSGYVTAVLVESPTTKRAESRDRFFNAY